MDAIAPNSARDSGNEDPAAAMQAARLADIITEQLQQCASKASEARLAATRMLRAAASAATQFGKAGPKAVRHLAGALATSCAVAVVATCKESMGVAVSDTNQPCTLAPIPHKPPNCRASPFCSHLYDGRACLTPPSPFVDPVPQREQLSFKPLPTPAPPLTG